nr:MULTISPECIES: hypothetical protein [Cupriavidus]
MQPVFDSALMYRRQLQDIIAATQAEFAKVAEVQYATSRGQLQDFIDSAFTNRHQVRPLLLVPGRRR